MTGPILSPDGKWMWTGSEWIPAPPGSNESHRGTEIKQSGNISDSQIVGNINRTIEHSRSQDVTTSIEQSGDIQDSVIMGDVNRNIINQTIVQTDVSSINEIFENGINRLIEMGFGKYPVELELSEEEQKEISEIINISDQAIEHGVDIDRWTEMTIGMAALNVGRFESAMNNFTRAKSKFELDKEYDGISVALLSMGVLKEWKGELDDAERFYQEGKRLAEQVNDLSLQAFAINNLGKICIHRNEYNTAKKYFENSLSISKTLDDVMGQGIAIHNLGLLSSKLGDFHTAISYYHQSLELETEDLGRAITLNNIGQSFVSLENTIEGRQFFQQTKQIAVTNDSAPLLALALNNLGVIEMKEGNLVDARKNYLEAKNINERIGSQLQLVQVLFNLADLSFVEQDEHSRHAYNQNAVNLSRELGIPINQWFIDNGY